MKSKKGQSGGTGQQLRLQGKGLRADCGSMVDGIDKFFPDREAEIDSNPLQETVTRYPAPGAAPRFIGDKVLTFERAHEGERKYVTILVADIADYSSLSEKLTSEEQYRIMARCHDILCDEVGRYGGTMTRTSGGTAKAVFGAPFAHEDHARRACDAALSISARFANYSKKLREEEEVELQPRIGLVSGVVLSGSLSSEAEISYEDLEDVEELIPKVRSAMKPGTVVVARSTHELVRDFFEFTELEKCGEPVRSEDVEVHELLRPVPFLGPIESRQVRGLSKFMGREEEMLVLLKASEKATKGFGQALAISGDAGVGKSRLIFELRKVLASGEITCLEGYCRSYEGVPPYHPFLDVLKSLFGIKSGDKEISARKRIEARLSKMGGVSHEITAPLHEILALTVEDEQYLGLTFREKRSRIFKAVATVLAGEARDKLVVVILEDLHWIDRTSEELLAYLIERIHGRNVLLLLLYRPEYRGSSRLGPGLSEIHLGELPEKPMTMLVETVLDESEVDAGLMDLIRRHTGGNPLFIEEIAMSLLQSGSLEMVDGKFLLKSKAPIDLVPKGIQGVISARMDRLLPEVKTTLQVASVIGREVPLRLLERVRKAEHDLQPHFLELQRLEFLYERVPSEEREFLFKHALTQEAAYQGMLRQKQKQIHDDVGYAIEEVFSERLDDFYEPLAHHFSRSGNRQKALQYLTLSAAKAQRKNSPWEALHFYREALRLLKNQPTNRDNKKEEIELLMHASRLLAVLDFIPSESEEYLKRGLELATVLDDNKSASFFRCELSIYYASTGDSISAERYSHDFLSELGHLTDHILTKDQLKVVVPIVTDRAMSGVMSGRLAENLPLNTRVLMAMEEAETHLESYGFPLNEYSLLVGITGGSLAWLGEFEQATFWARKSLDAAQETKNVFSLATAESWYGIVLVIRSRGEEAMYRLTRATQHFRDVGASSSFLAAPWFMLGYARFLTEDLDGAQKSMEEAIGMLGDSGIVWYLSYVFASLGMVHAAAGDVKSALNCIDSALEWSQKLEQKHWEGFSKIVQGKIIADSGLLQAAKAEDSILKGIHDLTSIGMKPYCAQGYLYLSELYAGTGRMQLAAKNLKKAHKMFKEMEMDYWLVKTQAALSRFQRTE